MIHDPCARPAAAGARWVTRDPIDAGAAARDEVKAFLRLDDAAQDAGIDRLIAAAIAHGEAFTGRCFLIRGVVETVPPDGCWRRLSVAPVRSIGAVEGLDAAGGVVTLAVAATAIDIDAGGDGRVKIAADAGVAVARASYQAGLAADWESLPEALRHGAVRLAAHLFTHRDAIDEGAPPLAIVALWRPWRRVGLL